MTHALTLGQDALDRLMPYIETAITRAKEAGADREWVRRHFVHHNKRSYFVIPNLYNVTDNEEEERRALAMNQLAGVFDDLKLVVALSEKELKRFGDEERRHLVRVELVVAVEHRVLRDDARRTHPSLLDCSHRPRASGRTGCVPVGAHGRRRRRAHGR